MKTVRGQVSKAHPRGTRGEQTIQRAMDDLRRIFRRVDALSRKVESVTGLTSPQLWALKVLRETGIVDPSTLARHMRLHPSTLAKVLERLIGKGLVEWRRPRRAGGPLRVALSREGDYISSRSPAVAQELMLNGLRRLSPEGLVSVTSGIARLVSMLGAKETPAHLLFSEEINMRPARRQRPNREASSLAKS